ncbi:MAG: hypothetical protein C5B54_10200, partial [Acidobacteria bacterium]
PPPQPAQPNIFQRIYSGLDKATDRAGNWLGFNTVPQYLAEKAPGFSPLGGAAMAGGGGGKNPADMTVKQLEKYLVKQGHFSDIKAFKNAWSHLTPEDYHDQLLGMAGMPVEKYKQALMELFQNGAAKLKTPEAIKGYQQWLHGVGLELPKEPYSGTPGKITITPAEAEAGHAGVKITPEEVGQPSTKSFPLPENAPTDGDGAHGDLNFLYPMHKPEADWVPANWSDYSKAPKVVFPPDWTPATPRWMPYGPSSKPQPPESLLPPPDEWFKQGEHYQGGGVTERDKAAMAHELSLGALRVPQNLNPFYSRNLKPNEPMRFSEFAGTSGQVPYTAQEMADRYQNRAKEAQDIREGQQTYASKIAEHLMAPPEDYVPPNMPREVYNPNTWDVAGRTFVQDPETGKISSFIPHAADIMEFMSPESEQGPYTEPNPIPQGGGSGGYQGGGVVYPGIMLDAAGLPTIGGQAAPQQQASPANAEPSKRQAQARPQQPQDYEFGPKDYFYSSENMKRLLAERAAEQVASLQQGQGPKARGSEPVEAKSGGVIPKEFMQYLANGGLVKKDFTPHDHLMFALGGMYALSPKQAAKRLKNSANLMPP